MLMFLLMAYAHNHTQIPPDCHYTDDITSKSIVEFDQSNSGWRHLAEKEGCTRAAVELIDKYISFQEEMKRLLYWHRGQILANHGDYLAAIKSMKLSSKSPSQDFDGWNQYVLATIAFMQKDSIRFQKRLRAITDLRNRPEQNLDILYGLKRCFKYSYAIAYANKC